MNQKQKLLGYYNYTVVLTYIGMLCGFSGILLAFEGTIRKSLICLMAAGICDMFDGAVAATKERTYMEKNFGIQIDSLSDLICFGVLPAVIVYNINIHTVFVYGICAGYVLCALIRLAYFNVDEQERQKTSIAPREYYYGLPVTLSALFLPIGYGCGNLLFQRTDLPSLIVLGIMAVLFILPFPLKKWKLANNLINMNRNL